ncbi:hypothetical protein [Streptomyces griseoluteus]|uniref:hypothetical protein n=1 Tax=Streptomyces griseoluteus TaxID=29306 RepID=UPI0036E1E372
MGEESLDAIMSARPIHEMGEGLLGAAATLLHQQGDVEAALLAADVVTVELVLWNSGDYEPDDYRAFFTVEPLLVPKFNDEIRGRIGTAMCDVLPRATGVIIGSVVARPVIPRPASNWRDQVRGAGGPKPTNHARKVGLEANHPVEDDLHFTNEWEHRVYQVLKEKQAALPDDETIGIMPLCKMRVLGTTREPDFLITYKGRVGVIEVDGPHHEGPKRASNDHSRTRLLINAGVEWVDRLDVRDTTEKAEVQKFVNNFLSRLGRR